MSSKVKKKVPRQIGPFTLWVLNEIIVQKRWLLLPVWVILGALALLILFGGASSLLPAIYIAF